MKVLTRYFISLVLSATLGLALVVATPTLLAAASPCPDLMRLSLADATITSATEVTKPFTTTASGGSGTITVPADFPFCRVLMTLTPSTDSAIHAEVWLPVAARWNGKFLGVGNGGLTGAIWHTSMVRPLQAGYAVANSDLGHDTPNAHWALGHPEKVTDYAHRADHVTAQASKTIIAAHYGKGPRLSYFHGCSNGGHQALMEAQRYPQDYDGIVAGAPWNNWTRQVVEFIWRARHMENFNRAKLPMITRAVVAQCGAQQGGVRTDGYLNDPRDCRFNPRTLQCKSGDGPDCLTPQEVASVERVYEGPRDPQTDKPLFPGFERGSEFGWSGTIGTFANNLFRSMVYDKNPSWDFHTFNFESDVEFFEGKLAALINSTNPDLSAFQARGGKLIMWHGWTDTTLEPRNSINYYNSVVAFARQAGGRAPRAALEETQKFFRLFMAPGVNHCGNGPGPSSSFAYTLANTAGPNDPDYDVLAALDRWVERGVPPDVLVASHFTNGTVDKTRPVCVYPKVARYTGKGNTNDLRSFVCSDDWDDFNRDFSGIR
jgi:feruloyl esterase